MEPIKKKAKRPPSNDVSLCEFLARARKAALVFVFPTEPHVCLHTRTHDRDKEKWKALLGRSDHVEMVAIQRVFGFDGPTMLYDVDKVDDVAMQFFKGDWISAHWPQPSSRILRREYHPFIHAACSFPKGIGNLVLDYIPVLTACRQGYSDHNSPRQMFTFAEVPLRSEEHK
jgi:hypothetical protein